MSELDKEIRDLREKTARTRYQFLKAELETCVTALDMAQYALSVGNVEVVQREVACVDEGLRTIRRFLPEAPVEQRMEVEAKMARLQEMLDLLRVEL